MATLSAGQDRDRAAIGDEYKWSLGDVYPDLGTWRQMKDAVAAELTRMRTYQGRLGSSAQVLAQALEEASRLDKENARPALHPRRLADQETREAGPPGVAPRRTPPP